MGLKRLNFWRCALLLLSGCGWHPVFQSGRPASAELPLVEVGLIPERSGQLLRLSLQGRFGRTPSDAASRYDLSVSFTLRADPIGILSDNTTTRLRLVAQADWKLLARDPQHTTLSSGFARDLDGLNVINQQYFAMDLESEAVQRRMADAIADQIAQQLAIYFDAHQARSA